MLSLVQSPPKNTVERSKVFITTKQVGLAKNRKSTPPSKGKAAIVAGTQGSTLTIGVPTGSSSSPGINRRVHPELNNNKVDNHSKDEIKTMPSPDTVSNSHTNGAQQKITKFSNLKIDTSLSTSDNRSSSSTPVTANSNFSDNFSYSTTTPHHSNNGKLRGTGDVRSPGEKASPLNAFTAPNNNNSLNSVPVNNTFAKHGNLGGNNNAVPIPDFITQTDQYGNPSTPRNPIPSSPTSDSQLSRTDSKSMISVVPNNNNNNNNQSDGNTQEQHPHESDPCDALLESFRMMCCCLLPEEKSTSETTTTTKTVKPRFARGMRKYRHRTVPGEKKKITMLLPTDPNDPNRVKLLPKIHPSDEGKKCLVLDLDETLVHSSFRAVPGADFVIPVQIEDVVHFVYVAKRPGVDNFLVEMAKYYEIVVYTASLNKYADPLLDLLDPHRVIRTRLFRESCVYYEGNYVKDLSLIDRDLSQSIIVDNSPNSYLFHPDNAIDCSSFIDDPMDRELIQIGGFLKSISDAEDVRGICRLWKNWPDVDLSSVKRQENKTPVEIR